MAETGTDIPLDEQSNVILSFNYTTPLLQSPREESIYYHRNVHGDVDRLTTLHDYIVRHRIERFAHRLISSVLSVKEIALEMEFDNYGNLVRLFKTYMGCTPTEYRERHRAKV